MVSGLAGLIVVLLFLIVPLALLIVALLDVARRDSDDWTKAGQNQVVWVLIVIFVGLIGPILYLSIVKPKLVAVATT